MERFIITLDESGTLHVPDVSSTFIWMDEPELVKLFGVIAPTLRAAVRAVYKSGIVPPNEAERYINLPDGNRQKVYGITLVIAIAFPAQYSWGMAFTGTRDRQDWQTWL